MDTPNCYDYSSTCVANKDEFTERRQGRRGGREEPGWSPDSTESSSRSSDACEVIISQVPDPLPKVSGSGNLASWPTMIKTKVNVLKMVDLGNRRTKTQEKQTLKTSPPPWRLCKLVQASRCSRSSNVLWLDGGALPELGNNISTFFWTPHPLYIYVFSVIITACSVVLGSARKFGILLTAMLILQTGEV